MKRSLSLMLVVSLIFSLVGCGGDAARETPEPTRSSNTNAPVQSAPAEINTGTELDAQGGAEKNTTITLDSTLENLNFSGVCPQPEFYTKYIFEFYGMPDFVARLVEEPLLSGWMAQFDRGERDLWELTLLSAVRELGISKEDLLTANADSGSLFSEAQIASLYSGDRKLVDQQFASPYALVVDGEIFTPDWLATHTPSDYEKHGITLEALEDYIKTIDIPILAFACVPVALTMKEMDPEFDLTSIAQVRNMGYDRLLYVMPEEIHHVISEAEYEEWVSEFLFENNPEPRSFAEFNVINLLAEKGLDAEEILSGRMTADQKAAVLRGKSEEIKKAFALEARLKEFSIEKNGNTYSLEWLSSQRIDGLADRGITPEDLGGLLRDMEHYSFTSEYEWIKSCYDRMVEDGSPS